MTFSWIKGHSGTQGNEESDKLAKEGARMEQLNQIDLQIPQEFDIQGAKLVTLDQSMAYQGIQEKRPKPQCNSTRENLLTAKAAIEAINGTKEADKTIWINARNPALRARVQQFVYKTIHNMYMTGDKWSDVPNFEDRARCSICNRVETMQHIITDCNSEVRKVIWKEAQKMWPYGRRTWPNIMISTILGIGSIALTGNHRQNDDQ